MSGGALAESSSVVRSGAITLSFTTGTVDGQGDVLVPFMSCALNGTFQGKEETERHQATLTFDNLAFLLMQFGEEYGEALDTLEKVVSKDLAPSRVRLGYAATWLQEGAEALSEAAVRLNRLIDRLAEPASEAAPRRLSTQATSTETAKRTPKPRVRIRRRPTPAPT